MKTPWKDSLIINCALSGIRAPAGIKQLGNGRYRDRYSALKLGRNRRHSKAQLAK